jgi:hypothetical protein
MVRRFVHNMASEAAMKKRLISRFPQGYDADIAAR